MYIYIANYVNKRLMLPRYLESCPSIFYVTSQIRRTPSLSQKQPMDFESHDCVSFNFDVISYLMLLSRNLFLCLQLETSSARLFKDLAIIVFSVKHMSYFLVPRLYGDAYAFILHCRL